MEIPDGVQGEKVDFVVSSILVNSTRMLHFAIIPYVLSFCLGNEGQVSKQHLQEKGACSRQVRRLPGKKAQGVQHAFTTRARQHCVNYSSTGPSLSLCSQLTNCRGSTSSLLPGMRWELEKSVMFHALRATKDINYVL